MAQDGKPNPSQAPSMGSAGGKAPMNESAPENEAQSAAASDDYLFYNVMPQVKSSGSLTSPVMQTTAGPGPAVPSSGGGFFASYKWYIIGGVVVAIVAAASYFVIPMLLVPEIEETPVVNRPLDQNSGGDQAKKQWLSNKFGSETCEQEVVCGDSADPDQDGFLNSEEYTGKTDPNNADSDNDGLADGDEAKIFSSDPLNAHTLNDSQYNDADFIKGGYSLEAPDSLLTEQERMDLGVKMKEVGLHQPTVATLQEVLQSLYNFGGEPEGTPVNEGDVEDGENPSVLGEFEHTPEAKQDRDAQRYNTTKNVSIALAKYYEDQKIYPQVSTFGDLLTAVKPYNRVATSAADPIDRDPYIYKYTSENLGMDFSLVYYSETQQMAIKIKGKEAQKFKAEEEAKKFDDERISDLELLRSALLVYSQAHIDMSQEYLFPKEDKYKTALVPTYMTSIPKDPQTEKEYEYKVSEQLDAFTLKAVLSNPPVGYTGYLCNQEECRNY